MKEYIGIMMTARGCGHCAHSRGNGIMGSGPHFMKPSVVDEFLSVSDNIMMLNIHFESMSGKKSQIREISKFSKNNDVIKQEFWSIGEDNSISMHVVNANTKTKKITQQSVETLKNEDGVPLKWEGFLNQKIPDKIENYTYYYPCFMIVKTANWLSSINSSDELYALTNAGKTRKSVMGKVMLDKDGKSFNERMVEPKKLFEDVTSGKVKIEPHIVDKKQESKQEVKPPPQEKKHTPPKPREKEIQKISNYVIKQY